MDPLNRKLFKGREARNTLRQMGGIVASSPELAQTVAKFANGGPTELQIPRVRSAIQEQGMSYPSYRMLSRSQKRELGYPVSEIGGQLAFDRFGVGMGLVNPTDRFSPSGLNVTQVKPDPKGVGRNIPGRLEKFGISPEDAARLTPDELDAIINDPTRAMRERTDEMPKLPDTAPDTAVNRIVRPGQVARGKIEDTEQKDVATSRAEAIRLMTGDDAYVTPEMPVEEQGTETGTPTKDDPSKLLDEARKVVESEEFDFDTSYEKALERFERILGDDSDEDKRKKALANMAMIGLAIAAGQSPDFLTNVAQGALVGMKGMQEAEADKRKTARDLRLAALKATMEQETEIRKAEAAAAKSKLEYDRNLSLEEAKARLRAQYGSGGKNPRALEDFVQNTFDTAFKAARDNPPIDMREGEAPIEYATRIADQAGLQQQIRFPDTYGISPAIKKRVDSALKNNTDPAEIKRQLEMNFPGIDPSRYGL